MLIQWFGKETLKFGSAKSFVEDFHFATKNNICGGKLNERKTLLSLGLDQQIIRKDPVARTTGQLSIRWGAR